MNEKFLMVCPMTLVVVAVRTRSVVFADISPDTPRHSPTYLSGILLRGGSAAEVLDGITASRAETKAITRDGAAVATSSLYVSRYRER